MGARELFIDVDGGQLAALDHGGPMGGSGESTRQVLLVHGSGSNAAVWNEVAPALTQQAHVLAVDLRGHGHSPVSSSDSEQYWRDLAEVTAVLGWMRPVLVGHSTGGYAVTAVTAAGLINPSALCIVDGFVLDERDEAARAHAAMATPQALGQLQDVMGYGWRGDADGVRSAVVEAVEHRDENPLNAGANAELVRAVTERSYTPMPVDEVAGSREPAAGWTRRPGLEEIAAVCAVNSSAQVFPSVEIYERVSCPMLAVLPEEGLYSARRGEVAAVVDAGDHRRLVDVAGGHNAPMTSPDVIAMLIGSLVDN